MPDINEGAPAGRGAGAPGPYVLQHAGGGLTFQVPAAFARLLNLMPYEPPYTDEADQAATTAFLGVMTPVQRQTWDRDHYLLLRSNLGHWWRIRNAGCSGNVDLMTRRGGETVPVAAFCAHPAGVMPYAVHWLSQLLTLVHDEARFTRVAVCHYGYPVDGGLDPDLAALLPSPPPLTYERLFARW